MVPAVQFSGWPWVSLVLAAPVAVWGAWPLHRAAWAGLGHGAATMDTLVSMAVAASFGWSVYALFTSGGADMSMRMSFGSAFGLAGSHPLYLDVAAGVPAAVLAGRYLEARARARSGAALTALAGLGAKTVAVLRDGTEQRVAVDTLQAGELFVVRPGEKIATDGVITEGRSAVDASLVTGESTPAEVGPGDEVTGATLNMSGRLVVRATRVGAGTLLAQITRLVGEAQGTKASAQRLADRIAAVFVPCVISLAVVTLGFWLGAGLRRDRGRRRGRGRPGGRLPVRARSGHADRPAGRGGPRRRAGHPGQERPRAGSRPARPGRRVRQDRHADHRDHAAAGHHHRRRAPARTRRCGWPGRWRTRPSTRSARPSRATPPRVSAACCRSPASSRCPGPGSAASWTPAPSPSAALTCSRSWGWSSRCRCAGPPRPRERRPDRGAGRLGRARCAPCWSSRTRCGPAAPPRWTASSGWAWPPRCSPGTASARHTRWPTS